MNAGSAGAGTAIGSLRRSTLEEFAPRTCLTDNNRVNISNLAAVLYCVRIHGSAVFINICHLPRTPPAPLVGGLVLTFENVAHDHYFRPRVF